MPKSKRRNSRVYEMSEGGSRNKRSIKQKQTKTNKAGKKKSTNTKKLIQIVDEDTNDENDISNGVNGGRKEDGKSNSFVKNDKEESDKGDDDDNDKDGENDANDDDDENKGKDDDDDDASDDEHEPSAPATSGTDYLEHLMNINSAIKHGDGGDGGVTEGSKAGALDFAPIPMPLGSNFDTSAPTISSEDGDNSASLLLRGSAPPMQARPHITKMPMSNLLSRVQAFLPTLQAANSDLKDAVEREGQESVDVEAVEDGDRHVQMDLSLGVFDVLSQGPTNNEVQTRTEELLGGEGNHVAAGKKSQTKKGKVLIQQLDDDDKEKDDDGGGDDDDDDE